MDGTNVGTSEADCGLGIWFWTYATNFFSYLAEKLAHLVAEALREHEGIWNPDNHSNGSIVFLHCKH